MMKSIWTEFTNKPNFETLTNDITCDTLVIGGGIAGILAAYMLKKCNKDVVVVESNEIGSGITQNTTAVISAQHDTPYAELIKLHGIDIAEAYLKANLEAVNDFKDIAKNFDCDFKVEPSYLFSRKENLSWEKDALEKLGYNAELTHSTELPFDVCSAVKFPDMASFHPLKFLYEIATKLKIFEHTKVLDISENIAFTKTNKIKFQNAIVATHFPFINRTGLYFAKMYQMRSYVIALDNVKSLNGTYTDLEEGGYYFRNYKNYLIIGKGDHRTGTNSNAFEQLKEFAHKHFPSSPISYMWANQDCVSLDNLPYVGHYGNLKNVFTMTGFNLWGMTNSMVAAKILADVLDNKENKFSSAFDVDRTILRKQLFVNFGVSMLNFIYPTVKRCPHLGCALKYNKNEHTWDCQCHGSRFDENGKLLDNPAKNDL